jgi:hypothetical protein
MPQQVELNHSEYMVTLGGHMQVCFIQLHQFWWWMRFSVVNCLAIHADKPIGLTLAPDPVTGQVLWQLITVCILQPASKDCRATVGVWYVAQIIVQNIKEGSPAANSQMIQVSLQAGLTG